MEERVKFSQGTQGGENFHSTFLVGFVTVGYGYYPFLVSVASGMLQNF
jgi:hypothetical protein